MAKIDDFTLSYNVMKHYVTGTFKQFYGKFIVLGKENIPQKGPVIFGVNHTNALMDALVLLTIVPFRLPIVFLARSDVFGNKLAAKGLRFTKILPAYRIRDGIGNVNKNEETFQQCAEILERGNAIGLMPEGNQVMERKIHSLVKGLFRIAFLSQEKMGENTDVQLIPVGLDYGDFVNPGSHLIINVGKPISTSDYMARYEENPTQALNEIRADFKQGLKDVTVDFATETHYDCFETAAEVATPAMLTALNLKDSTVSRFTARQQIAKRLVETEKTTPEKVEELEIYTKELNGCVQQTKFCHRVFEKAPASFPKIVLQLLLLLITSPFFVIGFILNGPAFFITRQFPKVMKIKMKQFFSSVYYAGGILIIFPCFYILNTVLFACLAPVAWWWSVAFFFGQFWVGKLAFIWYKNLKGYFSQICYKCFAGKNPILLHEIQQFRAQIENICTGRE